MEVPSNGQVDSGEWDGEQPEIHPLITTAFRALDRLGDPWVLLRGEDDLAHPRGDVDILVGDGQLPRLDGLLEGAGFRRVPARGHGSHRFYFTFDASEGFWLKLDIVSEISFGRYQQWHTPLAEGCLKRRIRNGLLWLPATTEQAWLLLLHMMLDKGGAVGPGRMKAVRVSGALASTDDAIAAYLDRQAGRGTAAQLLGIVRTVTAEDFREPAARLAAALTRSAPLQSRRTVLVNGVLRRVGTVFPGPSNRGIVVAVAGPPKPGTADLLQSLREGFPLPSRYVYVGARGARARDGWLGRVPGGTGGWPARGHLRGALSVKYHRRRGRLVLVGGLGNGGLPPRPASTSVLGRVQTALETEPDLLLVLDEARPRNLDLNAATDIIWRRMAGPVPAAQAPPGPPGSPAPDGQL